MSDESLYLMTPAEIAMGWLFGHVDEAPAPCGPVGSPRATLERVVLEAMSHQPCGVAFSGGRDSSLVLAVATHVARREGLPDPVPISLVFPEIGEAEEDRWQELVIRHLGIKEWQRVVVSEGELDLVGPLAERHLIRDGVVWSPTVIANLRLAHAMPNGCILDGEGGDEVLGVVAHRISPVTHLLRVPRPMSWRRVRMALSAVSPAPLRTQRTLDQWRGRTPWLRAEGRQAVLDAALASERQRPLSFASSVSRVPLGRAQVLWDRNRRVLARGVGAMMLSPLLHPDFVRAIANDGGVLGRGDRSMVLRQLAPDLLPDAHLVRTGKASFNSCYMSHHTRAFARDWDGSGVDHDLVNSEALRREWLSDWPSAMTASLLQQAWRAQHTAVDSESGFVPD